MEFHSTRSAFPPSEAFSYDILKTPTHLLYSRGRGAYPLCEESVHVALVMKIELIGGSARIAAIEQDALVKGC